MNGFAQASDDELACLIDETGLAWIVPHAAPELALLMPVVREMGQEALLGHLPKSHPAADALMRAGRAQLLFLGPNSVVTENIAGEPDWAPTWNFVAARLDVDIVVDDALTDEALAATVAHFDPEWRAAGLGPRYEVLKRRVIGFRATINVAAPRLKLGQDEKPAIRERIAAAFAGTPLGRWMEMRR
jgi:predicted FMN-binding regulatory protein PaiB